MAVKKKQASNPFAEISLSDNKPIPKKKTALEKLDTPADATQEQKELLAKFRAIKTQDQKAKEQYADALDSEYWVCLCFQNRDQKEEFLRNTKLIQLGDKYLNGMTVAKILNIPLTTPVPPIRKHKKPDKRLRELAMEITL